MRRLVGCLTIVMAILGVAQIRLSRGEDVRTEPPPPALWEYAQPPGRPAEPPVVTRSDHGLQVTYPSPATNCVTLFSADPNSPYTLTSVESGVLFDIDADGDLDRVAWTAPATDVSFLALDRDGDGRITSGGELIGDHTVPGITNGPNALRQLAMYPGTWGSVNSEDPLFATLQLWRDANHNGSSERDELLRVDRDLSAIGLSYERHRRVDSHGNQSRYRGFVHVRTGEGKNIPTTAEDDRARRRVLVRRVLESHLMNTVSPKDLRGLRELLNPGEGLRLR